MGIALLQQVVHVGAAYMGENVAWRATNALRSDLARHCLYLDMSFHNDKTPGELIERIDGDVSQLATFFSQLVLRVIGNLILMGAVLVLLWIEDWRLGLVNTIFSVISIGVLNKLRAFAVPHQKAIRETAAELFGYLEERLAGTEDIRSSGAVDFVLRGLYALHRKVGEFWYKARRARVLVRWLGGTTFTVGNMTALVMVFWMFREGMITLGTAFIIVNYVRMLGRPIRQLTAQAQNFQNVAAAVERLDELRASESKIKGGDRQSLPDDQALSVAFEDVRFAYDEDEDVLHDVSLRLESGRVLGLLGRTGSGKTTITRLIFRLYDPVSGRITLDGVDVRDLDLKHLRERVAMVTQDVQLFQASVRDNLTFFDDSIDEARIMDAIESLGLMDWFESLPEGLDTKLETAGRGLSAGEGQLLAFTRVFLRDPGLVILDEASSRLDPATEALIERAIDRLLEDRTAIVIAHRLGTVDRADEITIIHDGRIQEHGDRVELAADPDSRFAELLRTGLEEVLV
jgi:ABC-type multidrug transport system fused ATPase/permease subunit